MDQENAFEIVPKNVLGWAMRMIGAQERLARSVMSLYKGTKTRFIVDSEFEDLYCQLLFLKFW